MTGMAHGMMDILPTDCFGQIDVSTHAAGFSEGGLQITGIGAAGGCSTSVNGVTINAYHGVTDPTDTDAAFKIVTGKKSGAGVAALGAAETAFSLLNTTTSLMILLGDGKMGLGISPNVAGVFGNCATVSGVHTSPGYEPSNATTIKHAGSILELNTTNYSSMGLAGSLVFTLSHASQTEKILGAITTEMQGGEFPNKGIMKFYVQGAGSLLLESVRIREVGELVCNLGLTVEKGFVANEDGGNYNFRVETDNNENALYIKVSNDCVGICHNTPTYPLDIVGSQLISKVGDGTTCALLDIHGYLSSAGEGAEATHINMKASRGATLGSLVETAGGDVYGAITGYGVNTSSARTLSTAIYMLQDGSAGATYNGGLIIMQCASVSAGASAVLTLSKLGLIITGTVQASGYLSSDSYAGISNSTGTGQEKATIGTKDAAKNEMYFYDASGGTYYMQFKNGLITYLTYSEPA
jgi:hypothetical protein